MGPLVLALSAINGFARLHHPQAVASSQPACPEPASTVSAGSRAVKWKVLNHIRSSIRLSWVNFEGNEQVMETIGPGEHSVINTYDGHAWRARSPQGVLVAQAKASDEPLDLWPCLGMYGADKLVLEPELAERLSSPGRVVHERWQGERLASALARCDPWRFLSKESPFIGFHVACVLQSSGAESDPDVEHPRALAIFSDGGWHERPTAVLPWGAATDLAELVLLVQHALGLPRRAPHLQLPGWFSTSGLRLTSLGDILSFGPAPALLFEGGQWIWPPIAVGHTWTVHANGHATPTAHEHGDASVDDAALGTPVALRLVTLSLRPAAFTVDGFLQGDEAEHMQRKAAPRMHSSGIANVDADRGKVMSDVRTSTMTFVGIDDDVRLKAVARRVQCVSKVAATHMEAVQVLHYKPRQHYQAHHDFFDPTFYQQQPSMLATLKKGANNRLATVFMYLNDCNGGGETAFPRAGGLTSPSAEETLDCSVGLAVRPRTNKVVLFYSLLPSGDLDYMSQHIGCDVEEGHTKWAANFWLWSQESPMNRGGVDAIRFQQVLEAQLARNASC